MEEWHILRKLLPITTTDHAATERSTIGSLGDISWVQFRNPSHRCMEGMCHSTHPPKVQVHHCTWSVLPGHKYCKWQTLGWVWGWGEKAWVRGYTTFFNCTHSLLWHIYYISLDTVMTLVSVEPVV